jgi:uncharacterized repeat protein (TIGR01451 family)
VSVGGTSTLTFTLTNPSANTVPESGVSFADTFPSGMMVSTPNGLTNSCGGTATATAGGGSVSLTPGTIAVDSSCTVSVDVTGITAGVLTNTSGAVRSENGGIGNTATAALVVVGPPSIAKAFSPSPMSVGGTSTLTFTLTNPSANTVALSGVSFTDSLPSGLVVSSSNGLSDSCGGAAAASAGGGSVSLTGGSIAPASSCTVSVDVTGTTVGTFTDGTGAVSSTNGGTGNTATAALTVAAVGPPSIAKAFSPSRVSVGGTSALTFTLTNPSANTVALSGVSFTDSLPSGLVVSTPNRLTNSCGGTAAATAGARGVALTGGSIAVGSKCTVVVDVTGSTAGVKKNTSGAVSSTNGGTGNTATATLTVTRSPTVVRISAIHPAPLGAGCAVVTGTGKRELAAVTADATCRRLRLTVAGVIAAAGGKLATAATGTITLTYKVKLQHGLASGRSHARVNHGHWRISLVLPGTNPDPSPSSYLIIIHYGGDHNFLPATTTRRIRLEVERAGL